MLTLKGKIAVKIVSNMHRMAGMILDAADAIENRIATE
jgi:hypothetical protein